MRIYTRTGDAGETGLLGGARVPKDHVRIIAYGEIDELNSHIGSLRRAISDSTIDSILLAVQETLLEAGTEIAAPAGSRFRPGGVLEGDVKRIEESIDRIDTALPALRHFILPAGSEASCRAHLARCVCRRAERTLVHLLKDEPFETNILKYLNRLSDLLFMIARWANRNSGVPDAIWRARTPARLRTGADPDDPASTSDSR